MANWDNQQTRIWQDEVHDKYEAGFWAGYEAGPHAPLPAWWYSKAAAYWLPYERGYWFGREVRGQEGQGANHTTVSTEC